MICNRMRDAPIISIILSLSLSLPLCLPACLTLNFTHSKRSAVLFDCKFISFHPLGELALKRLLHHSAKFLLQADFKSKDLQFKTPLPFLTNGTIYFLRDKIKFADQNLPRLSLLLLHNFSRARHTYAQRLF
jgi:hypothetical protein